jgi:hypothetical protein
MVTRPAPSRLWAEEPAAPPELRTETERPEVRPDSERDSRPGTDLRDVDDRDEERAEAGDEDPVPLCADALPRSARVSPVGGELTMPCSGSGPRPAEEDPTNETTGARPQTPQYNSPPPMSS